MTRNVKHYERIKGLEIEEPYCGIDVNGPQITVITTTTLEDAIIDAADAADILWTVGDIKYYNFEYPEANGMTIFIRTRATDGTNSTQVEIPATYTLYEASYYHYLFGNNVGSSTYYTGNSELNVDGTPSSKLSVTSNWNDEGKWDRAFDSYGGWITTGTLHKIEISFSRCGYNDRGSAGVATVLIYQIA